MSKIRWAIPATVGIVIMTLVGILGGWFTVGAGSTGVRFDPLGGGVSPHQYGEGFHIKAPWVRIDGFNTKTQVFTMSGGSESPEDQTHASSVQTTTNEGLYVTLDISIQYHIDPTKAWVIRQNIGPEGVYQNVIILPQIRSTIRDIVSQYTAAEVYGEGKAKVEKDIFDNLELKLAPNNIVIESVLLRNVQLPKQLTDAIEAKKTAEQAVLQMKYILDKEKLEAERKVVEAGGIAESQNIIAGSLTPEYLSWYWIQTMKDNPKAIYVPIGTDGLPLVKVVE
jgi:regulator of protease activity HflC (stomatin/prohibitin superfamily)